MSQEEIELREQRLLKEIEEHNLLLEILHDQEAGITQEDRDIRAACESSIIDFARYSWNILEPRSREFKTGWVIDGIAEHLTAITDGEINRLLISVPPGFMKSMLTKIFWPAWEWGPCGLPETRYVTASYADHLSMRDARKMKMLITNPWFTRLWPHVILSSDQAQKANFHNTSNGFMLGTSVGGVGTGERGDRVIIDDPNSVKEAESKVVRESTNQWFLEVVPTRLNSEESSIMVIQQRTNEADVTGTILDNDLPYVHFSIPMEFEYGRKCSTVLGWEDPRKEEGELAWPERFPRNIVDELKKTLGPYATAAQLQQSPAPRGGGIIKREYWQPFVPGPDGFFPLMEMIIAVADTAYTEKEEADYSACVVMGVYRDNMDLPKIMIMGAWQERLALNALVNKLAATAKRFKVDRLIIENKATGISVEQEIRRLFQNDIFGLTLLNPKGDKIARLMAVEPLFAENIVYVPYIKDSEGNIYPRDWVEMLISQVTSFPKSKNDDLVDCISAGIRWLRDYGLIVRREERAVDLQRRSMHTSHKEPLYDI